MFPTVAVPNLDEALIDDTLDVQGSAMEGPMP